MVRTGALLAAVRSATAGHGRSGEAAAAPFAAGRWLFSHNGAVTGWPTLDRPARRRSSPGRAAGDGGALSDSALVWAWSCTSGCRPASGWPRRSADTVRLAAATAGGRLNLLLTDGRAIAATAWGDTLCWRADADGVVVASEPYDDDPGWTAVPDRTLLVASPDGVDTTPLQLDVPPEVPWTR